MITAALSGESLVIDGCNLVTGSDLIDLLHLGRTVPVYSLGERSGWLQYGANLIHADIDGSRFVIARKCLLGLLGGNGATSIRVQAVTV